MTPIEKRTKRRLVPGIAVATALIVAAAILVSGALGGAQKTSAIAFHDAMRKLWEDHTTWTRLAIVSLVAGLPDTGATVDRLMKNQEDIGNGLRPFYGDAAGNRTTVLLKDHIAIAAEIVVAAKAGDKGAVDAGVARWYANADEIAAFLSAANPKQWSPDMMRHMMHAHLDLTLQEAVAQLTGDYPKSVATYDEIHAQILEMADMLSAGIIAQFPNLFDGPVPK
jgi:hypothetical protein